MNLCKLRKLVAMSTCEREPEWLSVKEKKNKIVNNHLKNSMKKFHDLNKASWKKKHYYEYRQSETAYQLFLNDNWNYSKKMENRRHSSFIRYLVVKIGLIPHMTWQKMLLFFQRCVWKNKISLCLAIRLEPFGASKI